MISNRLNLLVEVWDKDHVGTVGSLSAVVLTVQDDFLGQYTLSFAHDSVEMDGQDVTVALVPRKLKEKVKGTLTFSLTYKRTACLPCIINLLSQCHLLDCNV